VLCLELLLYGPSTAGAGWAVSREATLRFVTIPRLYRQQHSEYEVVSRSAAEQQRRYVEEQRRATEAATKTMEDLRRQNEAVTRRLKDLEERERRSDKVVDNRPKRRKRTGDDIVAEWQTSGVIEKLLETLGKHRDSLIAHRKTLLTNKEDVLKNAAGRHLTLEEDALWRGYTQEFAEINQQIADVDGRVAEITEESQRASARAADQGKPWQYRRCPQVVGISWVGPYTCGEPAGTSGYCRAHRKADPGYVEQWGGGLVATLQDMQDTFVQPIEDLINATINGIAAVPPAMIGKPVAGIFRHGGFAATRYDLPELTMADAGRYWQVHDDPGFVHVWSGTEYKACAMADNWPALEAAPTADPLKTVNEQHSAGALDHFKNTPHRSYGRTAGGAS
jgi:hypothetical protein